MLPNYTSLNYTVTAKKTGEAGLIHFGPFNSEKSAQEFAYEVIQTPGWELDEVPILNNPLALRNGTSIR